MRGVRALRAIRCSLGVATMAVLAWGAGPAAADAASATYGVATQDSVPIRMSDGATLLADVRRPTGGAPGERFPVVVTVTPYNKAVSELLTDPEQALVKAGYIHVMVDSRGSSSSDGEYNTLDAREVADGPEVVRWASKLEGSTGTVGMYGASYLGIYQLLVAAEVGPDSPLKAIVPIVASNNLYRETVGVGGVPALVGLAGFFAGARAAGNLLPPSDLGSDPARALKAYTSKFTDPLRVSGPFFQELLLDGDRRFNSDYWESRSPGNGLDRIVKNDVATLLVGGWADYFQRGEPLNYAGLQNAAAGLPVDQPMSLTQRLSPKFQLIQGPYYHLAGGFIDSDSTNIVNALRWFDAYLKGRDTGAQAEKTPLHLFELGSNRWVDTGRWPIRGAKVRTLFLEGGRSHTVDSINDGRLRDDRPTAPTGEDGLPYDPVPPVCSRATSQYIGGAEALVAGKLGLFEGSALNTCLKDERALAPRQLTYTSEPMTEDTSIAGPINATLYERATRPETLTVLTLQDVAPDGTATPVTIGAQEGSFRANDDSRDWVVDGKLVRPFHPFTRASRSPMPVGRVARVDVEVNPVLARLKAGHRLRLTIDTNAAPALTPPPSDLLKLLGGTTYVQRSSGTASHVNVPLIKSDLLRTSARDWGGCQGSC
ncbi:CocE/NonD family hydrolase [Patulibacter sp. NPDC049589]|uniref:CocE/NonD family hydrolase n=1 Tax=Patulibacter sp. NPDC049589 TaxID=3154731 RepID=UPI00343D780D